MQLLTNFNIISELTASEGLQHSAVEWNMDAQTVQGLVLQSYYLHLIVQHS